MLASPEAARKVLREVCILRRVAHPAIVGLKDAFVRPGTRGPFTLDPTTGALVPSTLDAYIAMEYADGGDLFSLKGQLASADVADLVRQIAAALAHLHSRGVMHRDVKSANVLLTRGEEGALTAKLADFGSARSVLRVSDDGCAGDGDDETAAADASSHHLPHADSFATDATRADLVARPMAVEEQEKSTAAPTASATGFRPPLTRVVATPCYRAPEVVMSRGGYSAAMDVWSLGCVFGELLQRVRRVGDAATPALRVAPLFAVRELLPKTPETGGWGKV